jgi:hypothetical protein
LPSDRSFVLVATTASRLTRVTRPFSAATGSKSDGEPSTDRVAGGQFEALCEGPEALEAGLRRGELDQRPDGAGVDVEAIGSGARSNAADQAIIVRRRRCSAGGELLAEVRDGSDEELRRRA